MKLRVVILAPLVFVAVVALAFAGFMYFRSAYNQEMKASIGVRFIKCLIIIKTVHTKDKEIHCVDTSYCAHGFQTEYGNIYCVTVRCVLFPCVNTLSFYTFL